MLIKELVFPIHMDVDEIKKAQQALDRFSSMPTTPLWSEHYYEDWKKWLITRIKQEEDKSQIMKTIMKETRGIISPGWVKEVIQEIRNE